IRAAAGTEPERTRPPALRPRPIAVGLRLCTPPCTPWPNLCTAKVGPILLSDAAAPDPLLLSR
ncbi:MAG: hypothetical protein ACK559_32630, partial [bacterium]